MRLGKMYRTDYAEIKRNKRDVFVAYLYEKHYPHPLDGEDIEYFKVGIVNANRIIIANYEINVVHYDRDADLSYLNSCIKEARRKLERADHPAIEELYLNELNEFEAAKAKVEQALEDLESLVLDYDYDERALIAFFNNNDGIVINEDTFRDKPSNTMSFLFKNHKVFIERF